MRDAVLLVLPDEVLETFPNRKVAVALRLPIVVQFIAHKDAHFPGCALDNTGMLDAIDGHATRSCQIICVTKRTSGEAILGVPADRKPRIRVKLALLFRKKLIQLLIDNLQC